MSTTVIQEVQEGIKALQSKLSAEIKAAKAEQDAKIDAALTDLAQGGVTMKSMPGGTADNLGAQVATQFEANRELFGKTKSLRLEIKAAADPVSTASGRSIIAGGVGAIEGGIIGLQNAMPSRRVASTSVVEYSRFTGTQGAAAVQAGEGAAKAAIRPDHTIITQSALTIAGYCKMSKQALADSEELKRAVNITLMRSVGSALDAALFDGNITPAWAGFGALATGFSTSTYPALVDSISAAAADMQGDGFVPDVVCMSPAAWLGICTATGTLNDHYLSGSYLGAIEPNLRGLRVVLSPSVTAGSAMVLDSSHCELIVADGFSIEVGYSGDDFTKNLVTVLGELRVIPIFRTAGSALVVS
ncbi:phage major capsid protein [Thauera phenolivorans]|uniref:phage major capsid protein n=1 Tax=Thauera phenolivorans TaxID=1792543 RepID=UPI0013014FE8|nr:phage major capsid protein [Thauera phenolivorans]